MEDKKTLVVNEVSAEYSLSSMGLCPHGYKQTEAGVIPEDWDVSTIGSNTIWLSGGTPNRSIAEFWRGAIPWISGSTLKSSEIFTSDQFLTKEAVAAGSKMAPLNSTLLLVRGSALHSEIRAGLVVVPVSFNQDVKALIPNRSVEPKYLTFYILGWNDELLSLVSSAGNSAGVLDTALVQNFKFLKPPMEEQKSIAKALSDVDELIASLEKLIAKKCDIKTATMQQLLTGKKRLPGFGKGKGYKQTELGKIPEDWDVVSLGQISTFANGKPLEPYVVEDGAYNLITLDSVSIQGELKISHKKISFYDESLKKGDLVCVLSDIAHARLLGLCGVIPSDGEYVLNQRMGRIRFDDEYCPEYMRFKINQQQEFFRMRGQGSSQRHIYKRDIFDLIVSCPGLDEQEEISKALADIDKEIELLDQRLNKTKAIKQGMMQELLTGRTRLVSSNSGVSE